MKGSTLATIAFIIVLILGGWYYWSTYIGAPQKEVIGTGNASGTAIPGTSNGTGFPQGGIETGTIPTAVSTSSENNLAVTAYDFGFSPSTIFVAKGDHVVITLTDSGGIHNFVIDELGVATPRLGTNESTTTAFDANRAGTFQYYSSVGNDRANGMWGTLTITP